MILGFSGKMMSGKATTLDYIAKMLINDYAICNFADALKIAVARTFVPADAIQTPHSLSWINDNKDYVIPALGITVRQTLQMFGTDIMRAIWPDVWINAWKHRLPPLSGPKKVRHILVGDVRFENEVQAIHDMGGFVIRLTRNVCNDQHPSEIILDSSTLFDAVIDNANMTIKQTNDKAWELVFKGGWIDAK